MAFAARQLSAAARLILGCRPDLPEGFHPSDSLFRFALHIRSFQIILQRFVEVNTARAIGASTGLPLAVY